MPIDYLVFPADRQPWPQDEEHYHDGGTFAVTDEQAQADGYVDAAEVEEIKQGRA